MKKWLIGSFIGAILVFLWQFLSWTILQIHGGEAKYTPAQTEIMNSLAASLKEDGMYMLPTAAPGNIDGRSPKNNERYGRQTLGNRDLSKRLQK
jgi:hypothetical protein